MVVFYVTLWQAAGPERDQETPDRGGETPATSDIFLLQEQRKEQSCKNTLFLHQCTHIGILYIM